MILRAQVISSSAHGRLREGAWGEEAWGEGAGGEGAWKLEAGSAWSPAPKDTAGLGAGVCRRRPPARFCIHGGSPSI